MRLAFKSNKISDVLLVPNIVSQTCVSEESYSLVNCNQYVPERFHYFAKYVNTIYVCGKENIFMNDILQKKRVITGRMFPNSEFIIMIMGKGVYRNGLIAPLTHIQ